MKKEKILKFEQRKSRKQGSKNKFRPLGGTRRDQSPKTVSYLEEISTAGVTRKEAAMLYQGVYRPKVEYPLGQTFLTKKQVKKIKLV